jgi:hypothetical protein
MDMLTIHIKLEAYTYVYKIGKCESVLKVLKKQKIKKSLFGIVKGLKKNLNISLGLHHKSLSLKFAAHMLKT